MGLAYDAWLAQQDYDVADYHAAQRSPGPRCPDCGRFARYLGASDVDDYRVSCSVHGVWTVRE